jgi:integral membrane sensor domain MASE1
VTPRGPRGTAIYILELVIVGVVYFALANAGSTIATIYSNAMPIWTPAGLALAHV